MTRGRERKGAAVNGKREEEGKQGGREGGSVFAWKGVIGARGMKKRRDGRGKI